MLTLLAALVIVLTGPAAANAAVGWAPCPQTDAPSLQCGAVPVPLDRTGVVPGTVSLNVRRVPATTAPSDSAVLALAGGPGQAAAPLAATFAQILAPARATRDLLVMDQRGTGQSSPLTCPALSTPSARSSLLEAGARCAGQLGAKRGLFRTADSVADIEALREQAGYARLTIFAVSYGTKVALAYAAAHPDRVERLVLDSVVTPDGPRRAAALDVRGGPARARRALRGQCVSGHHREPDRRADVARQAAGEASDPRPLRGQPRAPARGRDHPPGPLHHVAQGRHEPRAARRGPGRARRTAPRRSRAARAPHRPLRRPRDPGRAGRERRARALRRDDLRGALVPLEPRRGPPGACAAGRGDRRRPAAGGLRAVRPRHRAGLRAHRPVPGVADGVADAGAGRAAARGAHAHARAAAPICARRPRTRARRPRACRSAPRS